MGHGYFSVDDYVTTAKAAASKPLRDVFASRTLKDELNPLNFTNGLRESRDSDDHPKSTPIIVALDVSGSMGQIAHNMAKEGLGVLFTEILDRKPVSDPHLMFMAIGDMAYDRAPIQVSQFESDNRIVDQLHSIFVEGGGGGNSTESYDAAWLVAGQMTVTDSFAKRGKKGYLFTVGDEESPFGITRRQAKKFLNLDSQVDYTPQQLLALAQSQYEVFHIMVAQGSHYKHSGDRVRASWNGLLGQRAMVLTESSKLAELIVSTIQIIEGEDVKKVVDSWSGGTGLVVAEGVKGLVASKGVRRAA